MEEKLDAEMAAFAASIKLEPDKKIAVLPEEMEIRNVGFVNSPVNERDPNGKKHLTRVFDFEMMVKPNTTVREIKDTVLARLTSLRYYQLDVEFWGKNLKDQCTLQKICNTWPWFLTVKIMHVHITVPDDMFKMMYESFRNMGIHEEKALMQTRNFMNTYQNKAIDHEYEIAERLEKARLRLLKHGIVIRNPTPPPPCE